MATETFQYTGSEQTWEVPSHLNEATFRLYGAGGGEGLLGGIPGTGGYVEVTIPVTPGEIYRLNVGGVGGDGTTSAAGSGGWNGGADGGYVTHNQGEAAGGGGGGASDIRIGGDTLDDRALVAAGGAGCAAVYDGNVDPVGPYDGGDGGADTGQDGSGNESGVEGRGGTQTSGGAGGVVDDFNEDGGEDGSFGAGGAGDAHSSAYVTAAGGGGGAGWYGGGGGGSGGQEDNPYGGGGGGGSNYIESATTIHSNTRGAGNDGDGLIEIEYRDEPTAPQNLTLGYNSSIREITTDWESVSDADGYRLYLSDSTNAADTGSVLADTTSTSHTETDVPDGDQRYYQVVSYVNDGESDPSNEVDVLTNLPPVENLSVDSVAGRYATLSWTDPSNNASGYRLLLSDDDDGTYHQDGNDIAPVSEGETVTHESTELLDGQLYGATVETFTMDATAQRTEVQDGLIGYWTMDDRHVDSGSIRDVSPRSNTGEINGATTGVSGNIGEAFSFDSSAENEVAGFTDHMAFTADSSFTISLWTIPEQGTDSEWYDLVGQGHNTANSWAIHKTANAPGSIRIEVNGADSNRHSASASVEFGELYHIVAIYDNRSLMLYQNGNQVSTGEYTGSGDFTREQFSIGSRDAGVNGWYDGVLDDIRIYNRALTESEIQTLYNLGDS